MRFATAALVVALSGFIALAYEIVWFRAYAFVSGSSPIIFGLLLGCYLLGIALGARASRKWCRDGGAMGDPRQLRALGGFFLLANGCGYLVVPATAWLAALGAWAVSLPLVSVSAALLGAVLPLVSHYAIQPDDRAGSRLSLLYLANILGSALGSLLTGCYLMDVWSLATIQIALLLAGLAGSAGLTLAGTRRWRDGRLLTAAGIATAAVLVHPWLYDGFYERMQFKADYEPGTRFASIVENRHGVITVTEDGKVYGGGAYDGVFSTDIVNDRNWITRAYLLTALRESPGRVLMVGLASGSWAQVVAHLPGLESLTIIEINPGYLPILRERPNVASLLDNSKVKIEIDDARRWLLRNPEEKFDTIVQNTTWHWRAHCTNLLSTEYLELCRAHLLPGGLFFFNTTYSEDALLTAAELFPHALRIYNFMTVSDAPLVFDGKRLERKLRAFEIDGRRVLDLEDPRHRARLEEILALEATLDGPPQKVGLETRASLLSRLGDATRITDDNMICEWRWLGW